MTRGMAARGLAVALLLSLGSTLRAQRVVDLDAATITELNAAFDAGTLTSVQLVSRYLSRIAAYDRQGPAIHAVITLNAKALETARALDAERKTKGTRSPLHGIPVVLKDNYDTRDLPTTGGSVLLEGYIPARDAVLVQKLRDAGAIVLAKVNMSEFASSGAYSSLGGQTLNPHQLAFAPGGSSGGTGAAIAAAFAQFGLGTDTGGSIRGPATVNGIVALKPTHGLLSRTGIIPLALSFDTGGPMARSVTDIAIALGAMTGVDAADTATRRSEGHAERDYTRYLKADALKGARIGIARDFTGFDTEVDWIVESSLSAMRKAGATIVEVRFPTWMLEAKDAWYTAVRFPEFPPQIADYLRSTPAGYPKTLAELIERSQGFTSLGASGTAPNASRWAKFVSELASGTTEDYRYRSVYDHALPMMRNVVNGVLASNQLDAIVYPTQSVKPGRIDAAGSSAAPDAQNIANLTGFPDLIVPAGFSDNRLPIGISFLGTAWSEPKLIALGYSFEQITRARRRPVTTPALPGEAVVVK
ncbi:amidase family protein [Gemmatimonas sp.]|jgi:amidase|uniref:amidase family protein n=1 Tax=Gemmatimonas sp. TaxID=1962908 RepID=UPI0037C07F76